MCVCVCVCVYVRMYVDKSRKDPERKRSLPIRHSQTHNRRGNSQRVRRSEPKTSVFRSVIKAIIANRKEGKKKRNGGRVFCANCDSKETKDKYAGKEKCKRKQA